MSLRTTVTGLTQASIWHELPSYSLAEGRRQVAATWEHAAGRLVTYRGRSYTRRFKKSVCMMAVSGAALPAQSDVATSAVLFSLPLPDRLSAYKTLRCPYIRTPVPLWAALAGACCVAGTQGAPAFAAASANASAVAAPRRAERAYQRLARLCIEIGAFGVLGKVQMALAAEGAQRGAQGPDRLAQACTLGAQLLLVALELVRVPVQLSLLLIEAVPAVVLGIAFGLGGAVLFLGTSDRDLWPEWSEDTLAPT